MDSTNNLEENSFGDHTESINMSERKEEMDSNTSVEDTTSTKNISEKLALNIESIPEDCTSCNTANVPSIDDKILNKAIPSDQTEKNVLNPSVVSDLISEPTEQISCHISSIDKPFEQHLDAVSDNEAFMKTFPDEDVCSDTQDEEIQLRWDDDDDDINIHNNDLPEHRKSVTVEKSQSEFIEGKQNDTTSEGKPDQASPDSSKEGDKGIVIDCESIVTQHGLKKPDMMLEIPSQELIDFMDDDEPDLLDNLKMSPDNEGIEILNDSISDENTNVSQGNETEAATNEDLQWGSTNVKSSIEECQDEMTETENKHGTNIGPLDKDQKEIISIITPPNVIAENENSEKKNYPNEEPQPSTSQACMITEMRRDSDEVGEVSDSLGLLAESTRVLEDDEEPEDEDDEDDNDDYDQYEESSNQMGAEYSEDSNALNSETDTVKAGQVETDNVEEGKETDKTETATTEQDNESCTFHISDIKTQDDSSKDAEESIEPMDCEDVSMTVDQDVNQVSKEELCPQTVPDKVLDQIKKEVMEQATDEVVEQVPDEICTESIDIDKDEDKAEIALSEQPTEEERINQSHFIPNEADAQTENENESILGKDDNVVLLESSSEEDISDETEKISSNQEEDTPIVCEDISNTNSLQQSEDAIGVETDLVMKESEETNKLTSLSDKLRSAVGLEVFNVDSDDEVEMLSKDDEADVDDFETLQEVKCVNFACDNPSDVQYYEADITVLKYYEGDRSKKAAVCENCANKVAKRNEELIEGIKTNIPLLDLDTGKTKQELVEISDSESEDEEESVEDNREKIGPNGAKIIEEILADMINDTWVKFKMDSRLDDAQNVLQQELNRLDSENKEINQMLNECQVETDKLRNEVYSTFGQERKELPAIVILDTNTSAYQCHYEEYIHEKAEVPQLRPKRRATTNSEPPAKKIAAVTAHNLEKDKYKQEVKTELNTLDVVDDDNVEVAVVKLSAESAPADLPPPGEVSRPPLRIGMTVYAMRSNFGIWLKAKVVELQSKNSSSSPFTMCLVRFEHKVNKNPFKLLPARCLAFSEPADVRLTIGTRIIATSEKRETFYSGVVAEVPNPVNNYRYLVFFDDGHAKYARHSNTRLVCECSPLVWEEVHPNSRDFVRQYLLSYPERPMVRLHPKQTVKTEWNGKWWNSRVMGVDASLALINLAGDRLEWIYRGSTRLGPLYLEFQAAERQRARPMPRSGPQHRTNMPYVEYTRYDEPQPSKSPTGQTPQQNEEMRQQRAVAKKSTASSQIPPPAPPAAAGNLDNVTSRVVYYTPKNAIRPYKMVPHQCGPKCRRTDVLALKELRTYNPLAKPLLSGWERQIVRFKGHKEVLYRAPCGRRLRNMAELHRYLRTIKSDMPVDLFDYGPSTHCLAEFVLNKCLVGKKDLSHGKENVPVPCVNYYDESLPEFCSYNTERTPTAGVPLNLDPEFLCGCDCDDDCADKSKCACWKMTLEGARTIGLEGDVGYVYRRLPEPLPSGIYECNSRCKCKSTCLNRVAQHPLQLKLQVFKTLNRGWGIRALNDVPKGAFLCVYAGNLLTDATANLDGLNEGDEYLAELDYIEVVEQMKEGYEEDIPESLKEPSRRSSTKDFSEDEESSSEEEEIRLSKDERDDDFQPGYVEVGPMEFNKRLRTRQKRKKEKQNDENEMEEEKKEEKKEDEKPEKQEEKQVGKQEEKEGEKENAEEDCITISDDEEVREPSRFTAQAGMDAKQLVSKYRSVRSYFGKDEACYIMDAKVQGNIGRYLNHSCCPNVFVQNVFVDTHDPRFPWVAFFALSHIRAGTELTWNYNYDVGSVPGKVLYCYCGAVNCRGRLL
ncbi:histone-lysine N-methyltransferase eggless-like [Battus philenor]|uniref:histone-lysine N-methyltransferase eggless-like n=1 Tax=Battus philenor TaxID=42288 RepID=UPI0035CEA311